MTQQSDTYPKRNNWLRMRLVAPLAGVLLLTGCQDIPKVMKVDTEGCHNLYTTDGSMGFWTIAKKVLGMSASEQDHDDVVQEEETQIRNASRGRTAVASQLKTDDLEREVMLMLPYQERIGTPVAACKTEHK